MTGIRHYAVSSLSDVLLLDYNTKLPVAIVPKINASNFFINTIERDSTGGKGNPRLISFEENLDVSFSVDSIDLDISLLSVLAKGSYEVKDNNKITLYDSGQGYRIQLGKTPSEILNVTLIKPDGTYSEIKDYSLISSNVVEIIGSDEFDINRYAVIYNAVEEAAKITIAEEVKTSLFTMHAYFNIKDDLSREDKKVHIVIPKAKISGAFNILMANLDNMGQNFPLEILPVKDKRENGLAYIYIL